MKKIFSAFAVILFAAFAMTSCGGDSDAQKVAAIFSSSAEKVSALTPGDQDGYEAISTDMKTELEKYKESTAELTDADCKELAESAMDFIYATLKFYGLPELSADEKNEAVQQTIEEFKNFKTLGTVIQKM